MKNFNIAKVNITFGFLFFIFSAGIGPYMVSQILDQTSNRNLASTAKLTALGKIQTLQSNGFKGDLDDEPVLANVGTVLANGIRAINGEIVALDKFASLKTAHAHGNLESILNIVVGLVLLFMTGPLIVRQCIGLTFVVGTILHSGLMYIVFYPPFNQPSWAMSLFQTGLGPILILIGLASMAVTTALWLKTPARE